MMTWCLLKDQHHAASGDMLWAGTSLTVIKIYTKDICIITYKDFYTYICKCFYNSTDKTRSCFFFFFNDIECLFLSQIARLSFKLNDTHIFKIPKIPHKSPDRKLTHRKHHFSTKLFPVTPAPPTCDLHGKAQRQGLPLHGPNFYYHWVFWSTSDQRFSKNIPYLLPSLLQRTLTKWHQ